MVQSLGPSPVFDITFYTAPSGPPSINSNEDAAESSDIVIKYCNLAHQSPRLNYCLDPGSGIDKTSNTVS